jgi:hypothetical protein
MEMSVDMKGFHSSLHECYLQCTIFNKLWGHLGTFAAAAATIAAGGFVS